MTICSSVIRALRIPSLFLSPAKKDSSANSMTQSRRCALNEPTKCFELLMCRKCCPHNLPIALEKNDLLTKIQSQIGNFRDLAEFNHSYIKQNVIYRSSSPISHQSPETLQDFLDIGIKSIIDLRSAIEIGHSTYEDDFLNDINYFWVHIDISMPHDVLLREGVSELTFYKQFVWYTLYYNKGQIRRVFDILSRPENYGSIIHCHAGRDRQPSLSISFLPTIWTS